MPWTAKQMHVWRAIAHGWKPSKGGFEGVSQSEAKKMSHEGVRKAVSGARTKEKVRKSLHA